MEDAGHSEPVAAKLDESMPSQHDIGPLSRYLFTSLPDLQGPLEVRQFTGGHSNLTFLLKAGNEEYVLKREPPGAKAKSAHDMAREYRMLASVSDMYDLAPKPILYCEDPQIMGGPFLLMQRIPGTIIRGSVPGEEPGVMITRLEQLIDAMATLHSLQLGESHLSLGRPDGYRRRQVEGWRRRFGAVGAELSLGFEIGAWLEAHLPATPQTAVIVHNDFKLDNLVWSTSGPTRLIGVLDWEMATIGDPLLDLACTLSFWVETDDPAPLRALRAMPSIGPGYPTRSDALHRYAQRTHSDVGDFTFYRCFGLFRRAVIEQQKYHRFRSGQTNDPRFAKLDHAVATLLEACAQIIG